MNSLSFNEAIPVLEELKNRAEKLKPEPVYFYPYLKRVLETQFESLKPQYPMDIAIPKENKYLLKGDLEPAKIIHLEEPIKMHDGTPMWFETTAKQMFLRFGYTNCDARYISNVKLDMEYIHSFLGGSSGHGKSVTINSMLGGLFYEYAPWELQVHMSDAKIIEFKKYGVGHIIPHISTIAATEDADFVISVLGKAFDEMNQRAKIFGNLAVSNLKSFREKTGLAYPRVLIVMDEVESTFKLAGKKAGKIADYIDGFARLGRAAGYHIFMATQNMSSDIPKSATGQIRVRMCLGANQTTSESVLGNSGACDNFGRIGKLIVNTEVLNGGNTYPANIKFQTPFLTDDNFEEEMEELETLGNTVGYKQPLSFYDEEDIKTVDTYKEVMDRVKSRISEHGEDMDGTSLLIGYPAFVSDDIDGILKVKLDHKDVENMVICSSGVDKIAAHINNIAYSLKDSWSILHYSSEVSMFKYTPTAVDNCGVRDASQRPLADIDGLIRKRLFLVYLDDICKDDGRVQYNPSSVEKLFEQDKIPKEVWGNSLMCRRITAFYQVQQDASHATVWKPAQPYFNSFLDYYNECVKCNAIIEPITVNKFGKVVYFLGDLSKIVGYGRDTAGKLVTVLKKTLQDCNRAGIVFILYSRSMEGLNDLVSGLRYAIFDAPEAKDWGRLRTEAPAVLSSKLAVLFDNMDASNSQKKFKVTLLKEEF